MPEKRGANVKDVSAQDFVAAYAAHLKRTGKIEVPKWSDMVKTGRHKEMPPYDPDWFYIRCASIARQIYLHPGVGIGFLNKRFGGMKRRGCAPVKRFRGSGGITRAVVHNLEQIKVVEAMPKEGKGRRITIDGQRDLDSIATQVIGSA